MVMQGLHRDYIRVIWVLYMDYTGDIYMIHRVLKGILGLSRVS